MSILLFLLVLFVLILVHEWGHFIAAKKTGMRVDEFAIGFPPKLFGIKKGETEYTFNSLPIGGFVRIYGENAEEDGSAETAFDKDRSFMARPKWAQALVLLAGITMNILFAWLLFAITFMVGVPTAVDEATASPEAKLYIAGTLPGSPADGVLPSGAVVLEVKANNQSIDTLTPTSFSDFVQANKNTPITVTYESDQEVKTAIITPVRGLMAEDPDRVVVGTSLALVEIHKESFFGAIAAGFTRTIDGIVSISVGLATLIKDAVIGEADFTNIAGPVGIVGMVGDAAAFGIVALLTFTAIISLNLAVINILPFPALDGGRLVFVIIEAISGRRVPSVWTGWINLVGFVLLMLLMAAVTFNDISRLF